MSLIYLLLVAHFVGDFLCQSDWMAVNKSKRWDALALHVVVYTLVLWPFVVFNESDAGLFLIVNALAHFIQDAITSRINARLWFFKLEPGIWEQASFTVPKHGRRIVNPWVSGEVGNRHWFFVGIGFDQLLHYVTLFVTAEWWLR